MSRDLSLMVKYETFNLYVVGSNPTGLKISLLHLRFASKYNIYIYNKYNSFIFKILFKKDLIKIGLVS